MKKIKSIFLYLSLFSFSVNLLAEGETILTNAASEPHVQDLCRMLVSMGANIDGIGSNILRTA